MKSVDRSSSGSYLEGCRQAIPESLQEKFRQGISGFYQEGVYRYPGTLE
jgi:hypothetical protein